MNRTRGSDRVLRSSRRNTRQRANVDVIHISPDSDEENGVDSSAVTRRTRSRRIRESNRTDPVLNSDGVIECVTIEEDQIGELSTDLDRHVLVIDTEAACDISISRGIGCPNNSPVSSCDGTRENNMHSSKCVTELNKQMQACKAISTQLFPHQMRGLAWMFDKENSSDGQKGAILADDVGLGKTLTVLALILTNHIDGKPMARPEFGFKRFLTRNVQRYMPQLKGLNRNRKRLPASQMSKKMKLDLFSGFNNKSMTKRPSTVKQDEHCLIDNFDDQENENVCCLVSMSNELQSKNKENEANNFYGFNRCDDDVEKTSWHKISSDVIVPPNVFSANRCDAEGRRATLIVVNLSMITHWLQQIEQHVDESVDINIFVHHGVGKATNVKDLQNMDIVLTTYSTLAAVTSSEHLLTTIKWRRVCLDECYFLNNTSSIFVKTIHRLDTLYKWIITGITLSNIMENSFMLPWLGFTSSIFNRKSSNRNRFTCERCAREDFSRSFLSSIYLRRTCDDKRIEEELQLTALKVTLRYINMSEEERTEYEKSYQRGKKIIRRWTVCDSMHKYGTFILRIMSYLQQLCCHKELLDFKAIDETFKEFETLHNIDPNVERSEVVLSLAIQLRNFISDRTSDVCPVCLSEFTRPVITLCGHIFCASCIKGYIESTPKHALLEKIFVSCPLCRKEINHESLIDPEPEIFHGDTETFNDVDIDISSSKVNAVLSEISKLRKRKPNEKVVVVSHFPRFLTIIQKLLTEEGYSSTRFDASMSLSKRLNVIAEFQSKLFDSPKILLLPLKTAVGSSCFGLGFSLTVANHLFLLEPILEASSESRIIDLFHRMGQTKDVNVLRFITKNSIEEKVWLIQSNRNKDNMESETRADDVDGISQNYDDIKYIFDI